MVGDVIHPLDAVLFGPGVHEVVSEMSYSAPSGVPCLHRTCFSRLRMVLQVVA